MDRETPSFGALLREARIASGLSQESLAERARVSTDAISALERGSRKLPQRRTLELLLEALELRPELRERLRLAALRPSLPRAARTDGPPDPIAAPAGNLPRSLTSFVGREVELTTLEALSTEYRLVTLTGTGGVGKTRTSLELAHRLRDRFPDGTWFVELGPLREAALVPKAIAAILGIAERGDTPLLDVVVAAIGERRLLVVLDNCEHLIDAAASAAHAILTRCPAVTIVAASREALRVYGEATYRLPALVSPRDVSNLTPADALRYSAMALFVARSRARDAGFALTETNLRAAADICRRLDGVPLALELAAAKTSVLTLKQIADRLNERFALLVEATRGSLPRQQSLRALIDWSFDLLSTREQELFSRLAIFAGSFDLAAAEAVSAGSAIARDDVTHLLGSLVEKSLVAADAASTDARRFRLLETTREYAGEKLRERGAFADVMRLHTAYVLEFARYARSQLHDTADSSWLDTVDAEIENIRTALEWSLRDRHDLAAGAEIAAAIGAYWYARSWDEGTRWLMQARDVIDALDSPLAALVLEQFTAIQYNREEALELATRLLAAYEDVKDDRGIARALDYVGQALINLGRFDDAIQTLEEGVTVAARARDDAVMYRLLALSAYAYLYRGDVAAATLRVSEAQALDGRNVRARDKPLILSIDAQIALAANDGQRAVSVARHALDVAERGGDLRGKGTSHYLLAHAHLVAGDIPEGHAHALAAIRVLATAQLPFALAEAFLVAAAIHERLSDDERAARLIGFARKRAAALPFRSAFLITGLIERATAALELRLGGARFHALAMDGEAWSEAVALSNASEGATAGSTNA